MTFRYRVTCVREWMRRTCENGVTCIANGGRGFIRHAFKPKTKANGAFTTLPSGVPVICVSPGYVFLPAGIPSDIRVPRV